MIRFDPTGPRTAATITLVAALAVPGVLADTVHEAAGGYLRFADAGRALIFTSAGSRELWIHELGDGATRRLTEGLPADQRVDGPFWTMTRDGSAVLLASFPVEGSYDPHFQHLYRVARDGSGLTRVVEGFQDPLALVRPAQLGEGSLLFRRRSAGGGLDLFSYHLADGSVVRLSRPDHPEARVDFVTRAPGTGAVVYVGDDERKGHRRLWRVDDRGQDRLELSARLPRDFVVVDALPGRSDREGDKDPVKLAADGSEVLFTAMDPATGLGAFDPRHLYRVSLGGGPVDEVFRTEQGEGTFEFWPVPARRAVVIRGHTPTSNHFVANLDDLSRVPLHKTAVGWQGTHQVLPSPATGRVFFFGDVETQDVRGYLYSARFDGTDSRRHALSIPYDERGALFPVLDPAETTILFRGFPRLPNTFELFAVSVRDGTQKVLSSLLDRQEVRWFELVPGRSAVLYAQKNGLWFRDWTQEASVRISESLPTGTEIGAFAPSPDGRRAAFVVRAQGQPGRLELVELP